MPEPRCLECGYFLTGLESSQCPECGRPFDLNNSNTFSTIPLFNRGRFWFPGFLLALGAGGILFPLLIYLAGFGWTVTIVLPLCLGTLIGYGCRVTLLFKILLSLALLAALVCGLFAGGIVGVFCGLTLAAVALGPLMLGTLFGVILRSGLKKGSWDQRWYLRTLMLLIALPLIVGLFEARFQRPYADESVMTSVVLSALTERAWDAVMLYDEVREPPPLLMRFALPHPMYTQGHTESVGDLKVCVYSKGRLVKRISRREPGKILAFDVVEQTKIENRSVKLKSGSFEFVPVSSNQTRVTLRTTYQPLLGPRWIWLWSEKLGIHTLHGYILNGMRLKVARDAASNPQVASGGGS